MIDRAPKFGDRIMVRSCRPSGWVPARVSAMQGEPGRSYGWVATDALMIPLDVICWRWPEPGEEWGSA